MTVMGYSKLLLLIASPRCHLSGCLLMHSVHIPCKQDVSCCIVGEIVYETRLSHPCTVDTLHNIVHQCPGIVGLLYL